MNKEIKALWLEALRSGEYVQGEGFLRQDFDSDESYYCCLGVLCDLYSKSEKNSANPSGIVSWVRGSDSSPSAYSFGDKEAYLPYFVVDWAGLEDHEGAFADGGGLNSLATLNDNGKTFEEIARVIEKKF